LGDWLPKISDDIHLVLVEPKPDKRTTTFKALQKNATISEYLPWEDRDIAKAEKWVESEAKNMGIQLNKKCIQTLLEWVGIDQWALFHALEKLALTDEITPESIKEVITASPFENVFNLFETALRGDSAGVSKMLKTLEQTDDVYRLSALLSSQTFQLAAVVSAQAGDNVARDFGIHPYVVQKLTPAAKKFGKTGVSKIINIFTELDDDMKISKADPWLLVERALIKVSAIYPVTSALS
jgi:DNA polymerase-3 subunit delta